MFNNQFLVYSLITFCLFFLCTKISYSLNLVDYPNKRKKHSRPTAFTGGVIIALTYLTAVYYFVLSSTSLNLIITIGFLIALVGLIDDKYNLNPGGKLSLQIFPIIYLIFINQLFLTDLGNYDFFVLNLGTFSVPFTLLCVLLLLNSFNYSDGIDGNLAILTLSTLIIIFFLIKTKENIVDADEAILFLKILAIPILIFIIFNFSFIGLPKLFLGDSGSLYLGFVISFLLIYLAKKNILHPLLLAWSIALIVYEFIAINLIRLKKKIALFSPGNDHLHHIINSKIKSPLLTSLLISFINIFFFILGYFTFILLQPVYSLIFFVFCFFIYYVLRSYYLK